MKIDYSQFLNMIPEVSLMAILIIVFLADLFTAVKPGEQKKTPRVQPFGYRSFPCPYLDQHHAHGRDIHFWWHVCH